MTRLVGKIRKRSLVAAVAVAMLLATGSAQAATNVYPAGGSSFTGSAEGWAVKSAGCNVPALCTASGGYDGANGNPAGSLAANTNIGLNLLTLFKSTVVLESPEFKVGGAGSSSLRLDRQFATPNLVDLAPQVEYTVALTDLSAGGEAKPLTETIASASGFAAREAAVSVTPGHTYVLTVTAVTSSSVTGVGLLTGSTSLRLDNVALSVQTPDTSGGGGGSKGGDGGDAGSGASGLSSSQLLSLLKANAGGTAVLKGNRLFVKGACPAQVGRTCNLSLQGLLTKKKAATTKRTSKVAKGKAKRLVLKVKPHARKKLAKSSRLLFRETVRAGSAKATIYKRLKLIRRR